MSKTASANLAGLAEALEPIYGPEGWATKMREEAWRKERELVERILRGEVTVTWAKQPEWPYCEACKSYHAVGNPLCTRVTE